MSVNIEADLERLERFSVRVTEEGLDPELICDDCGEVVCDVEHGDRLGVLIRVALSHAEGPHEAGQVEG